MTAEHLGAKDGAQASVHHVLLAHEPAHPLYLPPFAHFGHSLEELLDLARTRFHGGEHVVSPETLVAATQPSRNAIRTIVRNPEGEIKQLILSKNCRTNLGGTWLNILMGGDANANIGYVNTSGAVTMAATTVTPTTSPAWTVNQWAGHLVVAPTTTGANPSFVYGVILSNTATALTIDQWYNLTSTTGAAGTTPANNTSFAILNGQGPAFWLALSTSTTTEDISDATLASEFTGNFSTTGRWKGSYSQTTAPTGTGTTNSNAIYKLDAGTLTCTSAVNVSKMGLFTAQNAGVMAFEKKLATSANCAVNDTLDPSWSITDA